MAAAVKAADPNHLVSAGSEGFFGNSDPSLVGKNPASWAVESGQDFLENNKHMDYAVAHAWPDNWMIPDDRQGAFLADWLQSHLDAAKRIGLPLLFEEFGKSLKDDGASAADVSRLRDPVYAATYDAIEDAISAGEPLLGSMYWKWAFPTLPTGPYGVATGDSTFDVVKSHASRVRNLQNALPPRPGCVYQAGKAAPSKGLGVWWGAKDAKTGAMACYNDVSFCFFLWFFLFGFVFVRHTAYICMRPKLDTHTHQPNKPKQKTQL
jgi:hypothetical protein